MIVFPFESRKNQTPVSGVFLDKINTDSRTPAGKPELRSSGFPAGVLRSDEDGRPPMKPQILLENGKHELKTVRAVCPHDCPDTCGMVVQVRRRAGVSLRGDPDHPFTRGFLCQKVAHYLDRVYHPDRLLYPMKRVGPKGTGQFAASAGTRRSRQSPGDSRRSPRRRTVRKRFCPTAMPARWASCTGRASTGVSSTGSGRRCWTAPSAPRRRGRLRHHARHAGRDRSGGGRA